MEENINVKAAILKNISSPLVVDDIKIPDLDCGQVLVEVHASGICGAQIGEISGTKGEDKYLPHLLGHEGGGIVIDTGPGVTHIKKGDHVVMHWRKGLGIEAQPPKYKWNGGMVGGGPVTTFNEHAVISENRLTPTGKDIPFDIAALFGCAVTTGLGIINNEAQLKIRQSIAVVGCGGVGLNVIQGAAMVSANPIIAIDIHDEKLDMAVKMGATNVIKSENNKLINYCIEDICGNVDVFVECTGLVELIEIAYKNTAPNGKTILVGQPHHDKKLVISDMSQNFCGKTLMDSQGGLTNPSADIPRYLNLYREGKLKLDNLITHRFSLGQVNLALDTVRSGKAGRCVLEMN